MSAKPRFSNGFQPFWVMVPEDRLPEVWLPPNDEFGQEAFDQEVENCPDAYEVSRIADAADLMVVTDSTGAETRRQADSVRAAILDELNQQKERAAVLHLKQISSLAPEESD